jgi:hypothetical protein
VNGAPVCFCIRFRMFYLVEAGGGGGVDGHC